MQYETKVLLDTFVMRSATIRKKMGNGSQYVLETYLAGGRVPGRARPANTGCLKFCEDSAFIFRVKFPRRA
jgi:hypothetical protein